MHFNFHLSGDESPEQSRRIANAVLALGGLTSLVPETVNQVGKITYGIHLDTSQATAAIRDLADKAPAAGVSVQLTEDDLPLEPPSPMAAMAEALREKAASEQFAGALTSDEIRTVESLPPAPPVPTTSGLDKNGLPWDERIHSSSRAINADGTWRYRKNVPDETKREVEAELRGLVQAPPTLDYAAHMAQSIGDPNYRGDEYLAGIEAKVAPPVPVPSTPPAPPVPTSALQRTYSDVVNLIMSRKVQPDTYVAILGMSLPEFAKHVIGAPNDATLMFDALDAASRP